MGNPASITLKPNEYNVQNGQASDYNLKTKPTKCVADKTRMTAV